LEAQLHLACDDNEPRSFTEAERDAAWRAAMKTKMDAVEQNRTWELADLPRGHRTITLKWVFKLKRDEAGVVIKHKACLVGVYVDDLVIIDTKEAEVAAFKEEMKATFQMSDLGPLSFYQGIEVHQDDSGIMLR
jgi:hypothetical protein